MLYNGKPIDLHTEQEEVATLYAKMIDTDYVKIKTFNNNFFGDWKKLLGRNHVTQDLNKCDFTPIYEWCMWEKEKKKQMSPDKKAALREEKRKEEENYVVVVDGIKPKVGNLRLESPALFRGRGHPKMGKLKTRIYPSDVIINISMDAQVPECPIPGQSWKEVRHDNTVTWIACWSDCINPKEFKYVFMKDNSFRMLKRPSTVVRKYDDSSKFKDYIQGHRTANTKYIASKGMGKRLVAVVTNLIGRLAIRQGNEECDQIKCNPTLALESLNISDWETIEEDELEGRT